MSGFSIFNGYSSGLIAKNVYTFWKSEQSETKKGKYDLQKK